MIITFPHFVLAAENRRKEKDGGVEPVDVEEERTTVAQAGGLLQFLNGSQFITKQRRMRGGWGVRTGEHR